MFNSSLVRLKVPATILLMAGLLWNGFPFMAATNAQEGKYSAGGELVDPPGVITEETVVYRSAGFSGLWDSGAQNTDPDSKDGDDEGWRNQDKWNNRGRGRRTPTPTPTPEPTPTPTPIPIPTPTPVPSPTPGTPLARQWGIAARPGIKLSVDHRAWYRVTSAELAANGFDTSTSSYYWQLFRDGNEVPMAVNPDGSVEFFGTGLDSLYSGKAVYYLTVGEQAGLRLDEVPDPGAGSGAVENYMVQVTKKLRTAYIPKLLNGDAENWFGPTISYASPTTANFDVVNMDLSQASPVRVSVRLQGYTNTAHTVSVKFNNLDLGTVNLSGQQSALFEFDVPVSEVVQGTNQFRFQSLASSYDLNFVDSLAITYPRKLDAAGTGLRFGISAGDSARVGGFNSPDFSVYEVTNGGRKRISVVHETVNGTEGFSLSADNRDREFIAIAESQKENVAEIALNAPSSWNLSVNGAEVIVLAPARFDSYASELAARKSAQGLQSQVVLLEDIADEFGFGTANAKTVRDFLVHATTLWASSPQYVILFGDSSYDFRNYLGSPANRNLVPTKLIETFDMETASDGWLVDFDNDGIEDISIGRLPVGNETEAAAAVAKIVRYEDQQTGGGQFAALVADNFFEILNDALDSLLPPSVSSVKIERSVLGDSTMSQEIQTNASADPTMVSYLGHGTTLGWTSGNVFNTGTAAGLTNRKIVVLSADDLPERLHSRRDA